MHYIYILKSKKNGRLYTGYTSDLKRRFAEHNAGKSAYTKNNGPWVLVYYESYLSEEDARTRERMLKLRSKASSVLRKRIEKSINEG